MKDTCAEVTSRGTTLVNTLCEQVNQNRKLLQAAQMENTRLKAQVEKLQQQVRLQEDPASALPVFACKYKCGKECAQLQNLATHQASCPMHPNCVCKPLTQTQKRCARREQEMKTKLASQQ